VTQRVIAIPMQPLIAGDARYNIVVRPGDVIRLPPPKTGLVYVTGQVNRPGPYSIPTDGIMTLQRAIDSAGGLSGIAIPERVDLTRIVGRMRQATIRINMRAIAEGTQPEILIKPDDRINVGTNLWAFPLAVVRNGFRASYGFGFLLDRNFADEVFGVTVIN
jgi:polysaccharide biosynthesis/export protein